MALNLALFSIAFTKPYCGFAQAEQFHDYENGQRSEYSKEDGNPIPIAQSYNGALPSVTDANGLTSYCEYDEFSRLERIRDHEGFVLQEYEYNYAGQ